MTTLRRARWATRAQFALFGFTAGVWGVHIPSVKSHYALDAQALSIVLFAVAAGSVACLTQAGRWVTALGARRAAATAGVLMGTTLALALVSHAWPLLLATVVLFGAGCALFDVAINAEASALEAASGKLVMSGFHGMFSAGGMAGAALAALAIRHGIDAGAQLAAAGIGAALAAALASTQMLAVHPHHEHAPRGARWPRPLLVLGALAAVGLLAEGAIYDWCVLWLRTETGADPAFAALGFASFSAAMAAARFGGDALRARVAAPRLLGASAALAAVAMTVVLVARDPWVGLVGLACVGIGFANVIPILFIGASRVPGVAPARGIAAVSSMGYVGMVLGPPLVGAVAQATSLSWGLGVIALGATLLAFGSRTLAK
ncbi:MAG TPA: MFS transporter [Burkholderiaceae bacterium]|nr:MFS transporter [Burkholderiaceae bacterium]